MIKYCASAALLALAVALIVVSQAVYSLGAHTEATETQLVQLVDVQTRELNATVATTSKNLTVQVSGLTGDLHTSLAGIDNLTSHLQTNTDLVGNDLSTMSRSVTKVVDDSEIPALVRDTRMTVGQTALTMAHVRGLTNTLDKAAPEMVVSANKIAASSAGITADVHVLTTDLVKPRPWWKKVLSIMGDGVKLGSAFGY